MSCVKGSGYRSLLLQGFYCRTFRGAAFVFVNKMDLPGADKEAVLDRLKTRSLSKLQEIANECLPYVTTSMTNEEITDMLLMVLPMITELEIVNSGTCPASYKGKEGDLYKNGQILSYLEFNVNETKKAMRAITEGEIAE